MDAKSFVRRAVLIALVSALPTFVSVASAHGGGHSSGGSSGSGGSGASSGGHSASGSNSGHSPSSSNTGSASSVSKGGHSTGDPSTAPATTASGRAVLVVLFIQTQFDHLSMFVILALAGGTAIGGKAKKPWSGNAIIGADCSVSFGIAKLGLMTP
jgi:hypothetical protein